MSTIDPIVTKKARKDIMAVLARHGLAESDFEWQICVAPEGLPHRHGIKRVYVPNERLHFSITEPSPSGHFSLEWAPGMGQFKESHSALTFTEVVGYVEKNWAPALAAEVVGNDARPASERNDDMDLAQRRKVEHEAAHLFLLRIDREASQKEAECKKKVEADSSRRGLSPEWAKKASKKCTATRLEETNTGWTRYLLQRIRASRKLDKEDAEFIKERLQRAARTAQELVGSAEPIGPAMQLLQEELKLQELGQSAVLDVVPNHDENHATASRAGSETSEEVMPRAVFVVHGHDEAATQGVARFVEKLGLETIVLREEPDKGRTIIEKFEDHAREAGFAVVLLTPDDFGRGREEKHEKPRARQNVVFELGFFCSALGRSRVCALYKKDVELPTDYSGVLYTEMDQAEAWHQKLAKELKEAGFSVDMNDVL